MKRSRVVAGIAIAFFGSMAMMSGEAWGRSLEEPDSNVLIAQGHFEKSKDALGQRDYAEALRQNDLAIQAWPHPDLYYNKGFCLEQAGRLSEAIAAFKFYRSLIRKDQTKKRSLDEVNDRIKRLTDQLIEQPVSGQSPSSGQASPEPPEAIDWNQSPIQGPVLPEEVLAAVKQEEAEDRAAHAAEVAARPQPPAKEKPFFMRYRKPFFLAGGGVVVLGIGVGLAASAKASYGDLKSTCSPHCTDDQISGPRTLGYVGYGFLAAGAAVAAGGAIWGIVTWKKSGNIKPQQVMLVPGLDGSLFAVGTF